MKYIKNNFKNFLILFSIFICAFLIRIIGLNWDQNQHLHPDERFLTMVASDIKIPSSLKQYFDTQSSSLNPANHGYGFFVYGTLPLFLTKFFSIIFNFDNYNHINLVGRVISAIFDSLNIIFLYFISKKIFSKNSKLIFLPSVIYSFSVLPLQLSHFFTVDVFLSAFILLTFCLLCYHRFFLASLVFGLALSSKISAIYFCPVILIFYLVFLFKSKNFSKFFINSFLFLIGSFVVFRIFQPYAFNDLFRINPLFIENLKTLQSFSGQDTWYPPSIQWISKNPLLSSFQDIFLWGIGIPISLALLFFIFIFFKKGCFKKTNYLINISFIWVLFLYFYQGSQFSHPMRYFLPLYPFVFILFSYLFSCLKISKILLKIILFFHFIYGIMFLSIYLHPHSRIQASSWIYQNIPKGSVLTVEYWDDAIPLNLSPSQTESLYSQTTFNFYEMDTEIKWEKINKELKNIDFIIMSSNRLWASIPKVPQKYPITSKFYQDLFDQKLNFQKTIEINSYPGVALPFINGCYYFGPTNFPFYQNKNKWFTHDLDCNYPGFYLRDDIADESFTVYDHPKVLIYSATDFR